VDNSAYSQYKWEDKTFNSIFLIKKNIVLRHLLCHYCTRMSHGEGKARGRTNDLPTLKQQMGKNDPTSMVFFTCNSTNPIFGLLQPKMKAVILTFILADFSTVMQ